MTKTLTVSLVFVSAEEEEVLAKRAETNRSERVPDCRESAQE